MEISFSQRNGVSVRTFVALCFILRLASAELSCCQCGYVVYSNGQAVEQCKCRSEPEHRDCSNDADRVIQSSRTTSLKLVSEQKKGRSGEEEPACYAVTSYNYKEKYHMLGRHGFSGSPADADTCDWKEVNFYDEEERTTIKSFCKCKTDWCNCGAVEESFIRKPAPPEPGDGLECCACTYVYIDETSEAHEQCNCHSKPAKRDCTEEVARPVANRRFSNDFNDMSRALKDKGKATAKRYSCVAATAYNRKTKKYIFTRGKIQSYTSDDTCDWRDNSITDEESGIDITKICTCRKNWCNCDPLKESFILFNRGSFVGAEFVLTVLLTVLVCRLYQ